jgi:hypothetical protein
VIYWGEIKEELKQICSRVCSYVRSPSLSEPTQQKEILSLPPEWLIDLWEPLRLLHCRNCKQEICHNKQFHLGNEQCITEKIFPSQTLTVVGGFMVCRVVPGMNEISYLSSTNIEKS